jgi:hypothetical protein
MVRISLIGNLLLALALAFVGMQLWLVEPSRQNAAREGIKALMRGERLCQSNPATCAYVFQNNRRIATDVLVDTLDGRGPDAPFGA